MCWTYILSFLFVEIRGSYPVLSTENKPNAMTAEVTVGYELLLCYATKQKFRNETKTFIAASNACA